MNAIVDQYISFDHPFCIFQKDRQVTIVTGDLQHLDHLDEIAAYRRPGSLHSISMIPFCQIKERGFTVLDGGEKIIALVVNSMHTLSREAFLEQMPDDTPITLTGDLTYNLSDTEYEEVIRQVINHEIKNGEGSNFLLSRKTQGILEPAGLLTALTILKRFIHNEFGSYMNFCFFDGDRFFIGASPERHLSIFKGTAYLNPISGTMSKASVDFKRALLNFLQDPKEIHELFQVVDEELKMMAKICKRGGEIEGPFLKEMRTLIHTEYLLKGDTDMPPLDAFRETMYAPTMIGSPLENACRIIHKYEKDPRRYYSSAMLMLGDDADGEPFMDSAITIRTMELDLDGRFTVQAGASIVRDSVPERERIEAATKSLGALKAITDGQTVEPILDRSMDAALEQAFLARNTDLSTFWLHKQSRTFQDAALTGKSAVIVHNEDDFAYMLAHILEHLGLRARVERIEHLPLDPNEIADDLVILGPGPGDPENEHDARIAKLNLLTRRLFMSAKPFLGVCLGHQVICRNLGLRLERLDIPLQGVQRDILLFGNKETVGFYNTFVAVADDFMPASVQVSVNEAAEVNALTGPNFCSFQFHVESVLTRNGLTILKKAVRRLFNLTEQ